ncbi:hypothetical protein [Candidatus Mycoplasma haematominutum]|uniref:Uncharacterized protein n=1 Tax=Candidatus Mycoplasma haematominutum 'Birmingham 1' TaxID=1116213 RepID=G8C2S4_9MOLU|nr:hypothetical protein [Candidatus Mycoplasma haematominutum]CCE66622.1 hypothetical protein MHM_01040 [Candidatus Mycoplasma haematominutum 'Birmingham 1']
MSTSPKTRLALALCTGGTCAAGETTAIYLESSPGLPMVANVDSSVKSSVELTQLSSDTTGAEEIPAVPVSVQTADREAIQSERLDTQVRDKLFEEMWNKVSEKYRSKQTKYDDQNNHSSWKAELKGILDKEVRNNHSAWIVEKDEYKDCTTVTAGKIDYCGYIRLTKDGNEYRLKIDRYGVGGGGKKWDVTIVRKVGSSIQWYSKTDRSWKNTTTTNIDSFQGWDRSSHNWWIKLEGASINISS